MNDKKTKIEAKRENLEVSAATAFKERLALETKKSHDRADALTAKLAASIPAAAESEAAPEAGTEPTPEATAEAAPEATPEASEPTASAEGDTAEKE